MDRRTQRYVLVVLLIIVTLVLYRSLGRSSERYGGGEYGADSYVVVDEGPGELELSHVEPANATLGVRGREPKCATGMRR